MKLITRLEKSKIFWWIVILCTAFFLLRLPSTIEPYWYGDEGVYETIGLALDQGRLLYKDIWDNKPPLLYLTYALVHGEQVTVRFMSLFAGLFSLIFLFFLSQRLFSSLKITIIITSLYILLFATPIIEGNIANAENFMLLPITAAALLIYQTTRKNYPFHAKRNTLLFAGLLLGIAFLFKIVALFDFVAFVLFVIFVNLHKINKKHITTTLTLLFPFVVGFVLPLGITIIYFASQHALNEFISATFFGNISYVSYQNKLLGFTQGLLFIKSLVLFSVVVWLFLKRNSFSYPTLFVILWTAFSLFNVFFSGRPYTHYLLVMLPSFCLLVGLLLANWTKKTRFGILVSILGILFVVLQQFHPNFTKAFRSYQNAFLFVTNQKDITAYQAFYDGKTPRDYALASFITTHTTPEDTVFIWGDSPQIYALSNKLPPYKYTVAYHITQNSTSLKETQKTLDRVKPKYIVTLPESQLLPFSAPNYIMRFTIRGAIIYERSL